MNKPKKTENPTIEIIELKMRSITFCLLGTTPLCMNRMSEKAKHELLLPRGKLNTGSKQVNLKHDPRDEFWNSVYKDRQGKGPTRVLFPARAFASLIADIAIDIPGAKKAQIQRLTSIDQTMISIWGIPQLHMGVVRLSDISRTPDIRTRAIFPEWAARVAILFSASHLTERSIMRLMTHGGILGGIGEDRPSKGPGVWGKFAVVDEKNPDFKRIVKDGGLLAQDEALQNPVPFDDESEDLYRWAEAEIDERRRKSGEPLEAPTDPEDDGMGVAA